MTKANIRSLEIDRNLKTRFINKTDVAIDRINAAYDDYSSSYARDSEVTLKVAAGIVFDPIKIQASSTYNIVDVDIKNIEKLSFSISPAEILENLNKIFALIRDPKKVGKCLQSLDRELGEELQEHGIKMNDCEPQYYIKGMGNFIPGPPQPGYTPYRKQKLLQEILLRREREIGINNDGVAVFSAFVPHEEANEFVRRGNLYSEDESLSRVLLHGKYSHRLLFEVICQAMKNGELELTYQKEGETLAMTPQQVLELMVTCFVDLKIPETGKVLPGSRFLWGFIFDNVIDSSVASKGDKDRYDPENYSFSAASPFILKSLIVAFGKELEIPNLQNYLLDSHYKHIYQMIERFKQSPEYKKFEDGSAAANEFLYYAISSIIAQGQDYGDIGSHFEDFNSSTEERKNRFHPFSEEFAEEISKKKIVEEKPSSEPRYSSWYQYNLEKSEKEKQRKI